MVFMGDNSAPPAGVLLPNGWRLTCAAKRTLQLKEYNQFPCRTLGK